MKPKKVKFTAWMMCDGDLQFDWSIRVNRRGCIRNYYDELGMNYENWPEDFRAGRFDCIKINITQV